MTTFNAKDLLVPHELENVLAPDQDMWVLTGNSGAQNYTPATLGGADITIITRKGAKVDITYRQQYPIHFRGKDIKSWTLVNGAAYYWDYQNEIDFFVLIAGGNWTISETLSPPALQDSIWRDLEKLAPRAKYKSSQRIDQSIASGGADVVLSVTANAPGDMLVAQMGISQDTLGTSPHDSYIEIMDVTTGVGLFEVKGAVNPQFWGKLQVAGAGNISITAHNGDSVAHWFFANVTVIQS